MPSLIDEVEYRLRYRGATGRALRVGASWADLLCHVQILDPLAS